MVAFAATPTHMSQRLALVVAMQNDWEVAIADLSAAFLNGILEPQDRVILRAPRMAWPLPEMAYLCLRALD
jgi:hypothetical protein